MRQLLVGTRFDFMGKRKITAIISAAAVLISLVSLLAHGGPRLGIDFQGGTLVQILFDRDVPLDQIRSALSDAGVESSEIQNIESEYGKHREVSGRSLVAPGLSRTSPSTDGFSTSCERRTAEPLVVPARIAAPTQGRHGIGHADRCRCLE